MGIVQGSITTGLLTTGNYQITLPRADLDIIGFAPSGNISGASYSAPPIVGIFLDASNIAYFPMPYAAVGLTLRKYAPIHVKVKGTTLNIYIPYQGPYNQGLTIYYGIPDGSEIEIESLKGVAFQIVNTNTSSSVNSSTTVNFPSGNVHLRGIFVYALNGAYGQISFITGTGDTLYIPVAQFPDPMDLPDNIIALDLDSATTLTINYLINNNSSGNTTFMGIIYYE